MCMLEIIRSALTIKCRSHYIYRSYFDYLKVFAIHLFIFIIQWYDVHGLCQGTLNFTSLSQHEVAHPILSLYSTALRAIYSLSYGCITNSRPLTWPKQGSIACYREWRMWSQVCMGSPSDHDSRARLPCSNDQRMARNCQIHEAV
jgi:hypothetical protein